MVTEAKRMSDACLGDSMVVDWLSKDLICLP